MPDEIVAGVETQRRTEIDSGWCLRKNRRLWTKCEAEKFTTFGRCAKKFVRIFGAEGRSEFQSGPKIARKNKKRGGRQRKRKIAPPIQTRNAGGDSGIAKGCDFFESPATSGPNRTRRRTETEDEGFNGVVDGPRSRIQKIQTSQKIEFDSVQQSISLIISENCLKVLKLLKLSTIAN